MKFLLVCGEMGRSCYSRLWGDSALGCPGFSTFTAGALNVVCWNVVCWDVVCWNVVCLLTLLTCLLGGADPGATLFIPVACKKVCPNENRGIAVEKDWI